jgi:hypothetical protein
MTAAVALADLVEDWAKGIERVDATGPVALNQRSGTAFQPGIGPHTEANTVRLVMADLADLAPDRYAKHRMGVPYDDGSRQSCDLCLPDAAPWRWAIEVKMLRLMGDNGKPNDNILMHILSPYPQHRSALTDCDKLRSAKLGEQRGVLIYGYDYGGWPMDPAIEAFEMLARARGRLGPRVEAAFDGLIHPVHVRGRVFAWELP